VDLPSHPIPIPCLPPVFMATQTLSHINPLGEPLGKTSRAAPFSSRARRPQRIRDVHCISWSGYQHFLKHRPYEVSKRGLAGGRMDPIRSNSNGERKTGAGQDPNSY